MPADVVDTRYGKVRGEERDGVWRFLGIRYAAPPVGGLRLRPTAAPEPWAGVADATSFGPNAPQPAPTILSGLPGDPDRCDEDCLFLNIWTAGLDDRRRPVMVFVHGGAFVSGAGSSQLYQGEVLARRGDVVVVTINYRLGALGFAGHPDFADGTSPDCANWGLSDQVAALRWVQDSIAGFGGDPANVTVFGESAGAISVCSLLAVPAARRTFRRAVIESGPAVATSLEAAAAITELLVAELGASSTGALRSVPVEELLAAQAQVGVRFDGGAGLAFQPVVDGQLLPRHPADAIAGGDAAEVDLLIGTNRDEFKFFAFVLPAMAALDEDDLRRATHRSIRSAGLGERVAAEDVIEAYRRLRSGRGAASEPFDLFAAMASDWLFRIPSLRLADAHAASGGRTYCYLFEWETPFGGGNLGACHALELPFVFGTLTNPIVGMFCGDGPDARVLSATMQDAWTSFARTGEPVVGATGAWPRYGTPARSTMSFGPTCGAVDDPLGDERRYWEPHLGRYGAEGPVEGVPIGRPMLEAAGMWPGAVPSAAAAGT